MGDATMSAPEEQEEEREDKEGWLVDTTMGVPE
jgi:hypothetical protein